MTRGLFLLHSKRSSERDEEKCTRFSARIPLQLFGVDHVHFLGRSGLKTS